MIPELDVLFCGGAVGPLMLAAVVVTRSAASLPSRFGLALTLTLCTAISTLAGLPHPPTALDRIANAAIPLCWRFSRAWFDDAFRPGPIDLTLATAFLGCTVYASLKGRGLTAPIEGHDIAVCLGGMAFAIDTQRLAWRNRQGNLVEPRRQARTIFMVSVGLIILWLLGSEIVGRETGELAISGMPAAAGLSMGAFVITALLFGLRDPEVFARATAGPRLGDALAAAVTAEPLDAGLVERLATIMIEDRA